LNDYYGYKSSPLNRFMASSLPPPSAWHTRTRWLFAAAILVLGFVLALPPSFWTGNQVLDVYFDVLDGSYPLDLPAHLSHQQFAGRDFIFTYGLLTQLINSLGLIVPPGDGATLLRFSAVGPCVVVMLSVWGLLAVTGAPLKWRAFFYLLWPCFWPPYILMLSVKPMLGLLFTVVCGYLAAGPFASKPRLWAAAALAAWALAAPVLVFVTFDMGVLTGMALLLTAAIIGMTTLFVREPSAVRTRRRVLLLGGVALAGAGLVLAGCRLVPGWGSFFADSWEVVSGFNATMARGCSEGWLAAFVATAGAMIVLLMSTVLRLRASFAAAALERARLLALLAGCCFGLVWLRPGLTRSDPNHLRVALGPALFVLGCLFPCWWRAARLPSYRLTPLLCLPVLLLTPLGFPPNVAQFTIHRLGKIALLNLRPAQLEIRHPGVRKAVAAAEALPGDALYVWPYETVVNVLSGKINPDYTLQSYTAHTERLERKTIARLEAQPELPALVFADSMLIDEVEHLTRTPLIYRYLLDNYELAAPREPEFVVLRRRPGGPQPWVEQEIPGVAGSFDPADRLSQPFALPEEEKSECRASDLFLLRLRAARTTLFPVGKPGELSVEFLLDDGTRRVRKVLVAPDGEAHDVLVSACRFRDPLFLSHFHPTRCWQARERVQSLRLLWSPMDLLSRKPAAVSLERVVRLHRPGAVVVETSLAEQEQPSFWNACYRDGVDELPTPRAP
jgi:hypothetical protein